MNALIRPCLGTFVALTILTGVAYPLVVTGIAKLAFAGQAAGSVMERDGRRVGSRLLGQPFSRPEYFWSRPSATAPLPHDGAASTGTNLSPVWGLSLAYRTLDGKSEPRRLTQTRTPEAGQTWSMDSKRIARYFEPVSGEDRLSACDELRDLITFKQLNLMNEWPMKGPFDAIFCRNVIIYFDKATQRQLFERMAMLQRPGDYLFLGHSESLYRVSGRYELIGRTIYRRLPD